MVVKREGRKKVPFEKIEDQSKREVTFSKRRTGLFKKACELSILCSCQIAVVVFREDQKLFAFGHPSATDVANRYMNENSSGYISESQNDDELHALTQESAQLKDRIVAEKSLGVDVQLKDCDHQNYINSWWLQPIEELTSHDQLQQMMEKAKEFKHKLNVNQDFSAGSASQYDWARDKGKGKAPMT